MESRPIWTAFSVSFAFRSIAALSRSVDVHISLALWERCPEGTERGREVKKCGGAVWRFLLAPRILRDKCDDQRLTKCDADCIIIGK